MKNLIDVDVLIDAMHKNYDDIPKGNPAESDIRYKQLWEDLNIIKAQPIERQLDNDTSSKKQEIKQERLF